MVVINYLANRGHEKRPLVKKLIYNLLQIKIAKKFLPWLSVLNDTHPGTVDQAIKNSENLGTLVRLVPGIPIHLLACWSPLVWYQDGNNSG